MNDTPYLKGRRLRIFAGPNGSGKSTIVERIKKRYDLGIYINPDLLEQELNTSGKINLNTFGITGQIDSVFQEFCKNHSLTKKAKISGFDIDLTCHNGIITQPRRKSSSYNASLLSDFLRYELIKEGKKLTSETVMSHDSKIEILEFARKHGYKNYLYFICTVSPLINIDRVKLREKQNGHKVEREKILSRFERSLDLLADAARRCYRAFVFDNSGKSARLICEVYLGKDITFYERNVPNWVDRHLLKRL